MDDGTSNVVRWHRAGHTKGLLSGGCIEDHLIHEPVENLGGLIKVAGLVVRTMCKSLYRMRLTACSNQSRPDSAC